MANKPSKRSPVRPSRARKAAPTTARPEAEAQKLLKKQSVTARKATAKRAPSRRAAAAKFVSPPRLDRQRRRLPEVEAEAVDANWQDAYAQRDESPGGELVGRDAHRWELSPASEDDDDE